MTLKKNNIPLGDLQVLKENIEKLDTTEQIGLLHYLKDNEPELKNIISENQNGIFINLSSVNNIFIEHLQYYLEYVTAQREHLNSLENEKDKLKQLFNKTIINPFVKNLKLNMSVKS